MSYKLSATKNYGLFELSPFNRDVGKTKHLVRMMKEHGFIPAYPLHVRRMTDGKLQIVAGHHRFIAAKTLGIPVFYVVCDDAASAYELELQTVPWTLQNYLQAWIRQGSKPHAEVRAFADASGINISQVASMLAGQSAHSGNCNDRLKNGSYAIHDRTHAQVVSGIVDACKVIGLEFATHRLFVSAISLAAFLEEFEPDVFTHRLEVHKSLARKQATRDDYLAMIEAIYNRGAHNKLGILFLAKEAARRRRMAAVSQKNGTD